MSSAAASLRPVQRAALALALGGLLFLTYLLTFSGVPTTDDERYIIDTTDSLALRGSLLLNQTGYLRPVQMTDVEPAQPILSAPLYRLAYLTPRVGNVHALFLFTPLVTALTAIILFYYALDLGYREQTALAAALLFGLTTIVWPYTQTYFREPLTMLNLFAAAFLLTHWRRAFIAGERRHWLFLAAGVLVTVLALLSKEAALIALPALVLLAYPGGFSVRRYRRQVWLIGIGLVLLLVGFFAAMLAFRTGFYVLANRYALLERLIRFAEGLPEAGYGLAGYLISPGKGIWWYAPVLLLALGAPAVLPRTRWRESWLPLALLLWFSFSYAAIRGVNWHGGTGWGPRYLVPMVPFLMIAALPLIDRLLRSPRRWPRLILAALAVWGLVIQIGGTAVYIHSYYAVLDRMLEQPPWTGPAIWSVRWSQAVGTLLHIGQAETGIRWLIRSPDWLVLAVIGAGMAGLAAALIVLMRGQRIPRRLPAVLLAGIPLLVTAISGLALLRAYGDPRYLGNNQGLADLRAFLSEQARPQDTILLSSPSYVAHFSNYYKGQVFWSSLPVAPGERYSPEEDPPVVSGTVDELAGEQIAYMISQFSSGGVFYRGGLIWLVEDLSPVLEWSTRPVEHYLAAHYHMGSAVDFSPRVRLVQFVPLPAPRAGSDPAYPVDVHLGGELRLVGFDLIKNGQQTGFRELLPGELLGVSLLWEASAPPAADYTIGVFLIGPDGLPLAQHDRSPLGGFAPTGGWQAGDRVRDNYGFVLPEDAASGEYQVWVLAYSWPSLERLPVTGPEGDSQGDYVILTTLRVP